MQPHELIRAAAEIIKTGGWSQKAAARDHLGVEVPLFGGVTGDTSRAGVNQAAVRFSIYGALVKAQAIAGTSVANPGLMWHTLHQLAKAEPGAPVTGGTNYVHPVLGYNDHEGRTVEEVLSFLETCALTLEPENTAEPRHAADVAVYEAGDPRLMQEGDR